MGRQHNYREYQRAVARALGDASAEVDRTGHINMTRVNEAIQQEFGNEYSPHMIALCQNSVGKTITKHIVKVAKRDKFSRRPL